MVQGGLKKVQGGLEPPLAPYFPRLCFYAWRYILDEVLQNFKKLAANLEPAKKNCLEKLIGTFV